METPTYKKYIGIKYNNGGKEEFYRSVKVVFHKDSIQTPRGFRKLSKVKIRFLDDVEFLIETI